MSIDTFDRRDFLKVTGAVAAFGAVTGCRPEPVSEVAALPKPSGDICFMSARDLTSLIRARKLSAREVMAAHLARINRVNPKVNAIVAKLDDEQCLSLADAADQRAARGDVLPALHGLPIAFKDLQPAKGFPFTRGSLIYKDVMPEADSVLVERLILMREDLLAWSSEGNCTSRRRR